ncbi:Aliphatic sulfonates import ATP-binding protein SsuB [Halioglobus japonicus]|nr:Aliphatic sulfonates import ATP-binding protein SsuB [Halioglobus japonicus]
MESSGQTNTQSAPARVIEVQHLVKRFAGAEHAIIDDLSFAVPADSCLSLLGPSGCGKTTLLRLLMGLEEPSSGVIHVAPAQAKHMSYVFQEPRLVPWRTCLENVLLPLELIHQNNQASQAYALDLLQQLGLDERLQHFPGELSGGMQMRVALARALVTEPKIVLLDEPFAALDERTRFRMQDLLLELKSRLQLQYVFVTHSIAEAVYLGDQILLMDSTGRARDWRGVDFSERNQALKLAPAFNSIVQTYSQLFSEMERNSTASGSGESRP